LTHNHLYTPKMRILLVDDHEILLESLSMLISTIPNMEIVGQLNDSRKVLPFLENHEVDLLMTDMAMPYLDGVQLTLQARQKFPNLKVLMLTVSEEAEVIREAFRAGVSGYVMKKAGKVELTMALNTLAKGEKYFGEAVMRELLSQSFDITTTETYAEPVTLTNRELEIIKQIAAELSTQEIADKLFISAGTVETHRHNILRKLNVKNSIGIIKYAMKNRLI
jgi:DNA-binding NarL/FixJ family response regulator